VVENRAQVSAADIDALRSAGFDDGAIVEILAHVALNLFTNYVNVAFNVPVDFPAVKLRRDAA
jgi:alkylhydroperoxidase family enzyme